MPVLNCLLSLGVILSPHEKNAEIVQGFGIIRPQINCLAQIVRRELHLVLLGIKHAKTVVDFRIVGLNLKRMTEAFLRFGKVPLPPVDVAQIQQRNGVAGPQHKRLLEVLNRIVRSSFLGGHHAQIVPRLRIVGTQLQSLFKIIARSGKSFLLRLSVPRL